MCPRWPERPSKDLVLEFRDHSVGFLSCWLLQPQNKDREQCGIVLTQESGWVQFAGHWKACLPEGCSSSDILTIHTTCKAPPNAASHSGDLPGVSLLLFGKEVSAPSIPGTVLRAEHTSCLAMHVSYAPWGYALQGPTAVTLPTSSNPSIAPGPLTGARE